MKERIQGGGAEGRYHRNEEDWTRLTRKNDGDVKLDDGKEKSEDQDRRNNSRCGKQK